MILAVRLCLSVAALLTTSHERSDVSQRRAALVAFYEKHDPSKVKNVDKLLRGVAYSTLRAVLFKRYGVVPEVRERNPVSLLTRFTRCTTCRAGSGKCPQPQHRRLRSTREQRASFASSKRTTEVVPRMPDG